MRWGFVAVTVLDPPCAEVEVLPPLAAAANRAPLGASPPARTRRGSMRRRGPAGSAAGALAIQHVQPRNDSRRVCCFILGSLALVCAMPTRTCRCRRREPG